MAWILIKIIARYVVDIQILKAAMIADYHSQYRYDCVSMIFSNDLFDLRERILK